ncbi:hypothetical protein ACFL2U_01740 [Patescibacteria group bacterium]
MDSEGVKKLTLTQSALDAHPFKKRVVVGLFLRQDDILFYKKYNHPMLYLPGGTVEIIKATNEQIWTEKSQLIKFIVSKTGIILSPDRPIVEVFKNKQDIPIRAYQLTDDYVHIEPILEKWKKLRNYQPVWLTKGKIATHPYIPDSIKVIVEYYLSREVSWEQPLNDVFEPINVITIA